MELPPRARRIQSALSFLRAPLGTTSACAENTTIASRPGPSMGNYLRVRGEYSGVTASTSPMKELPPRARRIRLELCGVHAVRGTTSACAENTRRRLRGPHLHGNYLRVRGEYAPRSTEPVLSRELPPRARRIPKFEKFSAPNQ